MLRLLTGLKCYCPQYIGEKDLLISYDKIIKICNPNELSQSNIISSVINCEGLLAFPGLIDQHVHIIGGGGEEGAISRIKEIEFEDIIAAGVTTVVGVLGADSYTRSLENLLAKARGLEGEGLTTFIYTGSYSIPTVTITNSVASDLVLIDKVIGTGEVAISDHRSSQADLKELMSLAAETHIGGLIGGKAGVVHIHIGDGKDGLKPLLQVIEQTELPTTQFIPTHVNRNLNLFAEAIDYCKMGGFIDLTAGETAGVSVPNAIEQLLQNGVDLTRVTVSSDANGSIPNGGIGKIQVLYDDIVKCITDKNISPDIAFSLAGENVARVLKQHPKKGVLKEGSDADILITDSNYKMQKLFCKGNLLKGES